MATAVAAAAPTKAVAPRAISRSLWFAERVPPSASVGRAPEGRLVGSAATRVAAADELEPEEVAGVGEVFALTDEIRLADELWLADGLWLADEVRLADELGLADGLGLAGEVAHEDNGVVDPAGPVALVV
jgi:hypothetical protein